VASFCVYRNDISGSVTTESCGRVGGTRYFHRPKRVPISYKIYRFVASYVDLGGRTSMHKWMDSINIYVRGIDYENVNGM
jgi:hypothetical protein